MWPADHSAHPFYYPAILTDVSPHRLQFVRPCHIFPAFSPSQPPAPSIPPVSSQSINTDIQHSHGPARPQPARCAACRAVHISTLPHLLPHAKHCCPFQINPGELRRAPFPPSSNTENGRALAAISAFVRRARAKSDCTNTLCSRDILKYPLYSYICSQWQPMARPGAMGCPQCMSACVKTRHAARRSHKLAQYIAPAALQTLLQAESRLFRHVQLAHKINTKIFFQI